MLSRTGSIQQLHDDHDVQNKDAMMADSQRLTEAEARQEERRKVKLQKGGSHTHLLSSLQSVSCLLLLLCELLLQLLALLQCCLHLLLQLLVTLHKSRLRMKKIHSNLVACIAAYSTTASVNSAACTCSNSTSCHGNIHSSVERHPILTVSPQATIQI